MGQMKDTVSALVNQVMERKHDPTAFAPELARLQAALDIPKLTEAKSSSSEIKK
jgi:hypothetical protein